MKESPYQGLRIIERADTPAGELTGLQLAHLGAEVVKVESPNGSPSRRTGPYAGGAEDPNRSLPYWYYNANKKSVVIDLTAPDGRDDFDRLVAGADVLLISLHPLDLKALELDLDAMANGELIVVSITPFGLTGPWSEYLSSDLVALASSGLLITSGYDDHTIPPIRPGGDQAFHTGASFAHIGLLLALIERQHTGQGDLVDVSVHDSCAVSGELANPYWFYPKALVQRQTCRHAQPEATQPALFECADGYVYFALILSDTKPWQVLVEWLQSHDLALDLSGPAYADVTYRQDHFAHIQDVLECFFLLQPARTVYLEGQRRGLPIGILNAPEDLFADEHLEARGFFTPVEHPGFGRVLHPGVPYRLSSYSVADPVAAPDLGAHTEEVLAGEGPR